MEQSEDKFVNLNSLRKIDKFIRDNGKVYPDRANWEFPMKVEFQDGSSLGLKDFSHGNNLNYTEYTLVDKDSNKQSFNISSAELAYLESVIDDNNTNELISRMEEATHQPFKEENIENWYSTVAFLQPGEEGTEEFEQLADEEKYDEILSLASNYDYGDEINLQDTYKHAANHPYDDVLAENEYYAVVINNSVGGSVDIQRKSKTNVVKDILKEEGYRGEYVSPDMSDDVKDLARRMKQEDIANSYNNEKKYVKQLGEGFHFVAPIDHQFDFLVDADNSEVLRVTGVDVKNGRLQIHIEGRPEDEASIAMETIDQETWKAFGKYLNKVNTDMNLMLSSKDSPELQQVLLHYSAMQWPTNLDNLSFKTLQSLKEKITPRLDFYKSQLKQKDISVENRRYSTKMQAYLHENLSQIKGAMEHQLDPTYDILGVIQNKCEHYLSDWKGNENKLYTGTIDGDINKMVELYTSIPHDMKPQWIDRKTIDDYYKSMVVMKYMKDNPKKNVGETQSVLSDKLDISPKTALELMKKSATALHDGSRLLVDDIRRKGVDFYELNTALSLTSSELFLGSNAEFEKLVKSKDQKAIMNFYEKHFNTTEMNGHYLFKEVSSSGERTPLIGEDDGTSKVIARNKNGVVLFNKESGTYDYYHRYNYGEVNRKYGSTALQRQNNADWADPSDDLLDILQESSIHEHDIEAEKEKPQNIYVITQNGDKISDIHVKGYYDYSSEPFYELKAKVNGKEELKEFINSEDAKAFESNAIDTADLAMKYFPWKFQKHLTQEDIKADTVLDDGRQIEKFNIVKEGSNYAVTAKVGNKELHRYIGHPTLMAIKEGVVTPRMLVEQNFGQELHLKSFYEKYSLPENAGVNKISVRKNTKGEYLISADLGEKGHTKEKKLFKEDAMSLLVTKTATKEQLAAYYLKEDIQNAKVENKRSQSRGMKL